MLGHKGLRPVRAKQVAIFFVAPWKETGQILIHEKTLACASRPEVAYQLTKRSIFSRCQISSSVFQDIFASCDS